MLKTEQQRRKKKPVKQRSRREAWQACEREREKERMWNLTTICVTTLRPFRVLCIYLFCLCFTLLYQHVRLFHCGAVINGIEYHMGCAPELMFPFYWILALRRQIQNEKSYNVISQPLVSLLPLNAINEVEHINNITHNNIQHGSIYTHTHSESYTTHMNDIDHSLEYVDCVTMCIFRDWTPGISLATIFNRFWALC